MTGVQTCALPICFPVTIPTHSFLSVTNTPAIGCLSLFEVTRPLKVVTLQGRAGLGFPDGLILADKESPSTSFTGCRGISKVDCSNLASLAAYPTVSGINLQVVP